MSRRGKGFGWALLLELAPAALFGCAVAFAAAAAVAVPPASALPLIVGAVGGCGAWLVLRSLRGGSDHPLPQFDRVALEPDAPNELPADSGELLLDDVLARLEPGSRVVALFDRPVRSSLSFESSMNSNLRSAVRPIPTPPDTTEALHDALASARQSLR